MLQKFSNNFQTKQLLLYHQCDKMKSSMKTYKLSGRKLFHPQHEKLLCWKHYQAQDQTIIENCHIDTHSTIATIDSMAHIVTTTPKMEQDNKNSIHNGSSTLPTKNTNIPRPQLRTHQATPPHQI